MARIQWTPIVAPNDIAESAIRAQAMSGTALQNAFGGITSLLDQYAGSRREANLAEVVRRQNAFAPTDAGVQGYVADLADGDLVKGLNFLKASDLAAMRGYTGELRAGRNAEFAFDRQQVGATREDEAYTRGERDRESGIRVAREANAVRAALADPTITAERRAELTARLDTLAASVQNAGQINDLYTAGREGIQDGRSTTRFSNEQEVFGRGRTQWNWTREDRDTEVAAEALALKFKEYGPDVTVDDLIGSPEYQAQSPRVRARALALAGLPDSAVGSAPGVGGDDWTASSGMAASESGGNWGIVNGEGYGGRNQFGAARLADAARAGIIPEGMTGAQFARLPPAKQQEVEQWHWNDIDKQAESRGLTRFHGQTIGGVPINQASIRAMAQLGGIRGAQRFISSGGRYNPADSNGTRLSDYGRRFARAPITPQAARGASADMRAGAAIRMGTDRYAFMEEQVVRGLADTSDISTVARRLTAAGGDDSPAGPFAGQSEHRIGQLIQGVRQRYARANPGKELSAAAAAAILQASVRPSNFIGDGWARISGGASFINPSGGPNQNLVDWTRVNDNLEQIASRGQTGLAETLVNNENRRETFAAGPAMEQNLAALRSRVQAAEERDRLRGNTNNPATLRLRRQLLQAEEQARLTAAESERRLNGR